MPSHKQVALVIGASRGIGRQIAIDLARDGYAVVVAAKTTSDASKTFPFPPDPNSNYSTINTVAREIVEACGNATAIAVDTRDAQSIQHLMNETIKTYSRLDILIYNSGAIWWSSIQSTPLSRFQLMQRVNIEGLYATIQSSLPLFERNSWQGRIIIVSPPIYSRFFRGKAAYAIGKVGMSVLTKGLAVDFERQGRKRMSVTSIWPACAIQSAATEQNPASSGSGGSGHGDNKNERLKDLRKPTIFSDAILAMIKAPTSVVNGLLDLDEDFLRNHCGVTDFSKYSLTPGAIPRRIMPMKFPDLRVEEQDDEGVRMDSVKSKL